MEVRSWRLLLRPQVLMGMLFCSSWMLVSSGLIMLNKWILVQESFNYPILLTSFGMAFSSVMSVILIDVFHVDTRKEGMTLDYWCRKILPIGAIAAMCLSTGNIPYLWLSVSFIQILKALSPVFTLTVLSMFGLEKPTLPLIGSVMVIAVGTAIAATGEIQFSWPGTIMMITSEILEAIKLAFTQKLLGDLKLSSLQGTYYLCPATFLVLSMGFWVMESAGFIHNRGLELMSHKPWIYLLAGSMGFCVNFLSTGVIRHASSLWLKVLGQVKNAALVYGSTLVFFNIVTTVQYVGYGLSLLGFVVYSYVKADMQNAVAAENKPMVPGYVDGRMTASSSTVRMAV